MRAGGMGGSGFRGAAIGGNFRGAQASVSGFNGGNNFAGRGGGRYAGGGYRHGYGQGLGFAGGLAVGSALGYGYGYGGGYYGDDYYADNDYYDGGYDSGPSYVVSAGQSDGYCAQRYKSYDPTSGTYLGYDGLRHPCQQRLRKAAAQMGRCFYAWFRLSFDAS
ncbi:MAG TPA: BA14K family protein [Steroidobacteraceae bacterium]